MLSIFQEITSYDYRNVIHKAVPNVKILDDEPFLIEKVDGKPVLRQPPASHRPSKVPEHLKADWQLVSEGIKAVNIDEQEESSCMLLLSLFSCLDLHYFGHLFDELNFKDSFPIQSLNMYLQTNYVVREFFIKLLL